ncbi:MAG: hypothetical protein PWQ63_928 [Methanolobus sp.]|jgi:DNA-binding transcriptional regulator GbsR (MarR family)|nr:hypothetical protein [Methanolobus sp.]
MNGEKNSSKREKTARVIPVHPGDERIGRTNSRCSLLSPRKERITTVISGDPGHPRDDFIELITQNMKTLGFDEISSKILGVLFIETEEMSLEEIAIETGYSLSAISTAMKNLSQYQVIRRFTKPGSKKVFFFLDKDLVSMEAQILRMKYENLFVSSKKALPGIIEKYELLDSELSENELEIADQYYRQISKLEKIIGNLLEAIETVERSG